MTFKPKRYVTIVFPDFTVGHSLACYKCYSDTSWEDCDKEMYAVNCSVGYDEVCTKLVRTWWDDTKSGSEQQMTSYARGCDLAEACADKECKEKGWECTIECCSTNLCNTSITILPNFLLIEVFLYLALEAIAIF